VTLMLILTGVRSGSLESLSSGMVDLPPASTLVGLKDQVLVNDDAQRPAGRTVIVGWMFRFFSTMRCRPNWYSPRSTVGSPARGCFASSQRWLGC